ncbi:MAG: hypothetical protein BRC46_04225 [Cyanobacteria bacterium QS_6_48_18]|nr:MAG: hypothetical protein BRC46_04225 [Cyanobacteria bacterium QS_6_48_18]
MDSGAYYLQDTTGQIWVLTEESLPQEGDKVVVQGEVKYQSIPIDEQNMGEVYVREIKQLTIPSNVGSSAE